jgi:hypothetical protein
MVPFPCWWPVRVAGRRPAWQPATRTAPGGGPAAGDRRSVPRRERRRAAVRRCGGRRRGPGVRRAGVPSCGTGRLRAWGYGRERIIRALGGERRRLRPRRGRCRSCGATHILLPAWSAPRRADAVGMIARASAVAPCTAPAAVTVSHRPRSAAADLGAPIADSARLMPGEPQHGASTHIFQFCTDLVVERALSSRQMRAPEPLHRDRPRKPSQRSGCGAGGRSWAGLHVRSWGCSTIRPWALRLARAR